MKGYREGEEMERREIALLAFSQRGYALGQRLLKILGESGEKEVRLFVKCSRLGEVSYRGSVGEWTREHFYMARALIFIGACQIGVRSIGGLLQGKEKDPAVLVVDETGRFVIPILSGHLGGANALALLLAGGLGATPVITTATDLHGMFAIDELARAKGYALPDLKAAKEVSAALLAGERVGLFSDLPIEGPLPEGLLLCNGSGLPLSGKEGGQGSSLSGEEEMHSPLKEREDHLAVQSSPLKERGDSPAEAIPRAGIYFGCKRIDKEHPPFPITCPLVPPFLTLGMGCRRGIGLDKVRQMAERALKGYWREGIFALASIDLKAQEEALRELSKELGVPFLTYSAEELKKAEGSRTYSPFVERTVGVGNVCERAALLAAGEGRLLVEKLAGEGVTCALAMREGRLSFE